MSYGDGGVRVSFRAREGNTFFGDLLENEFLPSLKLHLASMERTLNLSILFLLISFYILRICVENKMRVPLFYDDWIFQLIMMVFQGLFLYCGKKISFVWLFLDSWEYIFFFIRFFINFSYAFGLFPLNVEFRLFCGRNS